MITADGLFGLCDSDPRSQPWGSSLEDCSYWRWKGSASFVIAVEGGTEANAGDGANTLVEGKYSQGAEAVQDEQQAMMLRGHQVMNIISGMNIMIGKDIWRVVGFCKVLSHCGRDDSPDKDSDRERMCVPSESNVSEGKEK